MNDERLKLISFNELSLLKANNSHVADFFYNWVKLKNALLLKSLPNILFSFSELENTNLAGVKLRDMIESAGLDQNQKAVLYNEINSSPFTACELTGIVSFSGNASVGLTTSHYNGIPTISLLSDADWNFFVLESNLECLDSAGNIVNSKVEIKNIANVDDLEGTWLESLKPNWLSSYDIFCKTLNSFDKVLLSERVFAFLKKNNSETLWVKFYNIVYCLHSYACSFWNREKVMWSKLNEKFNLNIRPESEVTLSKYGMQRSFHNELGKSEIFTYHFDMSKSLRGYLKEVPDRKIFFIGEITQHLDIVT